MCWYDCLLKIKSVHLYVKEGGRESREKRRRGKGRGKGGRGEEGERRGGRREGRPDMISCEISGHLGVCLFLLPHPGAFPQLEVAGNGSGSSMDVID